MDDLIAFLLARLDELEAENKDPDHVGSCHLRICDLFNELGTKCDCGEPAHQLADVAAKRQIIALHPADPAVPYSWGGQTCPTCSCSNDECFQSVDYPCPTLRLLALPDADHPDYRAEWKL